MDNEYQRAFALSKARRQPDDTLNIQQAVASGKFVVYLESLEHCPITDAVMGVRKHLLSTHDTREQAIEAEKLVDWSGADGGGILPSFPIQSLTELSSSPDDVPF